MGWQVAIISVVLFATACSNSTRPPRSDAVPCVAGYTGECRCNAGVWGSRSCEAGWTTPCDCTGLETPRGGGGTGSGGTRDGGNQTGSTGDSCYGDCVAMGVNFPSIPPAAIHQCCKRSCQGLSCMPRCSSGPYLVCEQDPLPEAAGQCERLRETLRRGLPPDGGPTGVGDACDGYGYVDPPDLTVACDGTCSFSCESAAGTRLCTELGGNCFFLVRYGDVCSVGQ